MMGAEASVEMARLAWLVETQYRLGLLCLPTNIQEKGKKHIFLFRYFLDFKGPCSLPPSALNFWSSSSEHLRAVL